MVIYKGKKRIHSVYISKDNKLLSLPKDNLLACFLSIGKDNNTDSKYNWINMCSNKVITDIDCKGLEFNNESYYGWISNGLNISKTKYIIHNIDISQFVKLNMTYQFGIKIDENNSFEIGLPHIYSICSSGKSILLKITETSREEIIRDCLTYNETMKISIVIENGNRLFIYLDEKIIYSKINNPIIAKYPRININTSLNSSNISPSGRYYYLLIYDRYFSDIDIMNNNDILDNYFYDYYEKDKVLDINGRDPLIFIDRNLLRDNSIYKNHFNIYTYFKGMNSNYNIRNKYIFNKYDKENISCINRKLIYDEFTIELFIEKTEEVYANNTYILGNYNEGYYGFRVGLNLNGLIIEFAQYKKYPIVFTYNLDYYNKDNSIVLSYKNNKFSLIINNKEVLKNKTVKFYNFYNDLYFYLGSQNLDWDKYTGNISRLRIYKKQLSLDLIKNNNKVDLMQYEKFY